MQGLSTKLRKLKIVISREEIADIFECIKRYTDLSFYCIDLIFEYTDKEHTHTDMIGSNFSTATLQGWNLCHSNFDKCNLHQTWFSECLLRECTFTKSNISASMFLACKLDSSV